MEIDAHKLPVEKVRKELVKALGEGPVVLTAPTGSGKSTQVPRWCAQTGKVLIIEPRRVACRGLASRVAMLEKVPLGERVGYIVRDDNRTGPNSQIIFATPKVVLRWIANKGRLDFSTIIIDEFHERSLDTDLLLAIFSLRFKGSLLVMSATLNADHLCRHLNARHVHAAGRTFPVDIRYLAKRGLQPDYHNLEDKVADAVKRALNDKGDILVFLPGKSEIASAFRRLSQMPDFEILQIHGGLSLKEQGHVFSPSNTRRIILATNVAETSITIPGVGVVIDSGLVKRTLYANGRGYLTLVSVARDSADQRAGRAGRTASGVSYRLWSKDAALELQTPPEIYRESLGPLLLAAAACNERINDLPFLDPPKDYALESAETEMSALGAIDTSSAITDRGQKLFGLPLDAALGSLLVEAKRCECLEDAIDLVAGLSVGRPLFGEKRPEIPGDDLRLAGCDATAVIRAIREGEPKRHFLNAHTLIEARSVSRKLRTAWKLPKHTVPETPISIELIIKAALKSDPSCAYVARRRKDKIFWGNGGPEIMLTRESAVNEEKTEAVLVLSGMAIGVGLRNRKLYGTCAVPVKLHNLVRAGLGEDKIKHVTKASSGTAIAHIERIYAGKVIQKKEEIPKGALAVTALKTLFLEKRIFKEAHIKTEQRLKRASLLRKLIAAGIANDLETGSWNLTKPVPSLANWVEAKLISLGVESGNDLNLLSKNDLKADPIPDFTKQWMDRYFPQILHLGNADYDIEYDLTKKEVTLIKTDGPQKEPPSLSVLPNFTNFKIRVRHHSKVWVLRH